MGLIDRVSKFLGSDALNNSVREMMIARPEDNNDLVWKHPDRWIPMFAQCAVRADEWAVFTKEGKPIGTLDTGRSVLSTSGIPFLSNIVDHYAKGDGLMTDLFFVRRTSFWVPTVGNMGAVIDPLAQVRLHLQCAGGVSMRVVNPELFLSSGLLMRWMADQKDALDSIGGVIIETIKKEAARLAAEQRRTIPDVLCDHAGLSEAISREISDFTQVGLQITSVRDFEFDLPPEESLQLAVLQAKQSRSTE